MGFPEQVKLVWRPHANLKVDRYIIERSVAGANKWSKIAEVKEDLVQNISTQVQKTTQAMIIG